MGKKDPSTKKRKSKKKQGSSSVVIVAAASESSVPSSTGCNEKVSPELSEQQIEKEKEKEKKKEKEKEEEEEEEGDFIGLPLPDRKRQKIEECSNSSIVGKGEFGESMKSMESMESMEHANISQGIPPPPPSSLASSLPPSLPPPPPPMFEIPLPPPSSFDLPFGAMKKDEIDSKEVIASEDTKISSIQLENSNPNQQNDETAPVTSILLKDKEEVCNVKSTESEEILSRNGNKRDEETVKDEMAMDKEDPNSNTLTTQVAGVLSKQALPNVPDTIVESQPGSTHSSNLPPHYQPPNLPRPPPPIQAILHAPPPPPPSLPHNLPFLPPPPPPPPMFLPPTPHSHPSSLAPPTSNHITPGPYYDNISQSFIHQQPPLQAPLQAPLQQIPLQQTPLQASLRQTPLQDPLEEMKKSQTENQNTKLDTLEVYLGVPIQPVPLFLSNVPQDIEDTFMEEILNLAGGSSQSPLWKWHVVNDDEQIKQIYESMGDTVKPLSKWQRVYDMETEKPKHFGFATFHTVFAAKKCIDVLDGMLLNYQSLEVIHDKIDEEAIDCCLFHPEIKKYLLSKNNRSNDGNRCSLDTNIQGQENIKVYEEEEKKGRKEPDQDETLSESPSVPLSKSPSTSPSLCPSTSTSTSNFHSASNNSSSNDDNKRNNCLSYKIDDIENMEEQINKVKFFYQKHVEHSRNQINALIRGKSFNKTSNGVDDSGHRYTKKSFAGGLNLKMDDETINDIIDSYVDNNITELQQLSDEEIAELLLKEIISFRTVYNHKNEARMDERRIRRLETKINRLQRTEKIRKERDTIERDEMLLSESNDDRNNSASTGIGSVQGKGRGRGGIDNRPAWMKAQEEESGGPLGRFHEASMDLETVDMHEDSG